MKLYIPDGFFVALEKAIKKARLEIIIQTYILRYDTTGKRILQLLNEAAERGVKIHLMLDAYGSAELRKKNIILHSNIHIRYFSSLFRNRRLYIGRRLHHKIYIADDTAFVGGMNISDDYSGWGQQAPWLDAMVEMNGPEVQHLRHICLEIIGKKKARKLGFSVKDLPELKQTKILRNDWKRRLTEITKMYRMLIRNAHKEIVIMGGYFMPGRGTLRTIENAAQRGVDIQIIIGENSDVPVVNRASRFVVRSLIKRGARVKLWNQSVVHGKMMMTDNQVLCIGSHNFNVLSDYGSLELNVLIPIKEFPSFIQPMQVQISQCNTLPENFKTTISDKILDAISYLVVRVGLMLYVRISEN